MPEPAGVVISLSDRFIMIHLGIDIAKLKFDVALLAQGKFKTKVFAAMDAGS